MMGYFGCRSKLIPNRPACWFSMLLLSSVNNSRPSIGILEPAFSPTGSINRPSV